MAQTEQMQQMRQGMPPSGAIPTPPPGGAMPMQPPGGGGPMIGGPGMPQPGGVMPMQPPGGAMPMPPPRMPMAQNRFRGMGFGAMSPGMQG